MLVKLCWQFSSHKSGTTILHYLYSVAKGPSIFMWGLNEKRLHGLDPTISHIVIWTVFYLQTRVKTLYPRICPKKIQRLGLQDYARTVHQRTYQRRTTHLDLKKFIQIQLFLTKLLAFQIAVWVIWPCIDEVRTLSANRFVNISIKVSKSHYKMVNT